CQYYGSRCYMSATPYLSFFFFFFQAEDGIRDLIVTGVQTCALPISDRAMRPPDPCVEQAQVVVDLRDRPDGRARVPRGRLLVDRDRGREAVDRVDVGLLHHLQELPRVRRQRLDVAALSLRVDRVEGKARLPGPGQARDADERVPREPDGDVLQVVLPGAMDDELVGGHRGHCRS